MKKLSKEHWLIILKVVLVALAVIAIVLAIYLPLKLTGTLEQINTIEKLKKIILGLGGYGYLMLFVLQFLQTTILPTPTFLTTIAATLIYGPWITFAITYSAVILGSIAFFFLGRKLGKRTIHWALGKKIAEKWEGLINKGKYSYCVISIFPFFPQDFLCLVAGTTNMKFYFFFFTNLIARPITILFSCFLGTGQIIPYHGWGIPVWIALVLVALVLFILSYIYSEKIDNILMKIYNKLFSEKKKKSENNSNDKEILGETEENNEQEKENITQSDDENDVDKTAN